MKKPYRYIIYFMIGVIIYFFIGGDENPEVLNEFHSVAPGIILVIVISLIVVRYIIEKKKRDRDGK